MAQVFVLILGGLTLGLLLSMAVQVIIRRFIYGVSFNDPLTFIVAAVLMLVVSALASYIPVRRAIKVDPTIALRCE